MKVAKVFPAYHFSHAMQKAYFTPTGSGWSGGHLLIMGAWGVAGVILASLFFSWEPRR